MKKCELCTFPARTYCESDQAILCWDCDAEVHRANFLVARHWRSLLCHTCQSLTPLMVSGSKLDRTVCVCKSCIKYPRNYSRELDKEDREHEGYGDSTSGCDSNDGVEDDDDQVVPWSSTTPPPAACMTSFSSSTNKGYHGELSFTSLRKHHRSSGAVSSYQVDKDRLSSQAVGDDKKDGGVGDSTTDSCCSRRRLKKRRIGGTGLPGPPGPV